MMNDDIATLSSLIQRIANSKRLHNDFYNTNENLMTGEQLYRQLAEILPVVLFKVDQNYNLYFLNAKAYQLTGYGENDLRQGLSVYTLFDPDKKAAISDDLKRAIESDGGVESRLALLTKSGYRIETAVYWSSTKGEDGSNYIQGMAVDISERIKTKRQLDAERNFIVSLLDTANGLIICLDEQAKILVFNRECERVTGYTKQEVLGKSWPEIFVPEAYWWPPQYTFAEWLKIQPRDRCERPIRIKSGELRNILWSNSIMYSSNQDDVIAIAIGFDITEKKNAEAALFESEEKYRKLLAQSDDAIYLIMDNRFEFVNDRFVELLGWSRDELTSPEFEIMNIVAPCSYEFMAGRLAAAKRGEMLPTRFEYTALTKDKRELELQVSISYIAYKGKKVIQGVYHDITEMKRTQAALEESEERYRAVWEKSPVGICLTDFDGIYHYVNPAYCRIYGYSETELVGKCFVDIIVPEHKRIKPPVNYQRSFAAAEVTPPVEIEFIRKDGRHIWVQSTSDFVRKQGKPILRVSMNIDITSKRLAEDELKLSETRFKAQFKALPNPTYTWRKVNDDYILNDYNYAADKETNGKLSSYLGVKIKDFYPDQPHLIKHIEDCFNEQGSYSVEEKYLYRTTREEKYLAVVLTYAPPDLVLVCTEDISHRRQNIIRNNARLNLLIGLRTVTNINECLSMACEAIYKAELFRRSVITIHNENREIVNVGYYGISDKIIKQACLKPTPDISMRKKIMQEKFRISNSYFIPFDSELELQKNARRVAQINEEIDNTLAWKDGDELFTVIYSDTGVLMGWVSVDTPFNGKRPVRETVACLEEIVDVAVKKIHSLYRLNELNHERELLEKKNIALNELLSLIEEEKLKSKRLISETVDQVLLPTLHKVINIDGSLNRAYYNLLESNLLELSLSMGKAIPAYSRLSSREVDICQMIKRGSSSKEIAEILHVTVGTVEKHRENIRKKLGISNKDINLVNFLKNL